MEILDLIKESYETAKDKGWWDDPKPNIPEKIALMHSELSEALEEVRKGMPICDIYNDGGKPEGFTVELADVFIRIADLIGRYGLESVFLEALQEKLAYNRKRPYRHGNKTC